jgi:hypothetical protein
MKDDALPPRDGDQGQVDEQRVARAFAVGLPLVTIATAVVVAVLVGPATSILVLAAGLLLGVIALLWSSIRILSGEAVLSPELEALDMAAQGIDGLASRKKMLLRALKDLENERAIGKIEADDYEPIASTYRAELKAVLKRIDDSLAPHRAKAEEAARRYLEKVGLELDTAGAVEESQATGDRKISRSAKATASEPTGTKDTPATSRVQCPNCSESNEVDAKFCKACATKLSATQNAKAEDSDDA